MMSLAQTGRKLGVAVVGLGGAVATTAVAGIEVIRRGKVRRARLFYLRGLSGKAARIKEKRLNVVEKVTA